LQTTATEYCAELLRLLQSNDVINARFLWNRIADSVKVDPQLRAVWGIGAASLSETRGDPAELTKALSAFAWQPPVAALVDAVRHARVDRVMTLVGRAYSTISLEQLAALSGLDGGAAAAARCASEGWRIEGGTVHPAERAAASRGSDSRAAALRQLQQLSAYVTHLEAESTTKLLPRDDELLVSVGPLCPRARGGRSRRDRATIAPRSRRPRSPILRYQRPTPAATSSQEMAIRKYLRTNGLEYSAEAGAQDAMRIYVHHLPEKKLRAAVAALGGEETDVMPLLTLRDAAMARIVAAQSERGGVGRAARRSP
jgi:hypothetical protein